MKSLSTKIICILLLFTSEIYSQTLSKEQIWEATTPTKYIPDSLLDEDAVRIYQHKELVNRNYATSGSNFCLDIYRTRIKILTSTGLDQYSNYSFYKSKNARIIKLDARTIKSNGNIVDLKSDDIKIISINKATYREGFENLRISIPGVEIGDEIELVYNLEYDGLEFGNDINLHADCPIIKSTFRYTCDRIIITDFKLYNNMPDATISKGLSQTTFDWELNNLSGLGDQEFGLPNESLPFIRFAIRGIGGTSSQFVDYLLRIGISSNYWGNVYDNYSTIYNNEIFNQMYKGTSLQGYLNKHNASHPNETIEQKLIYLNSIIQDSLEIIKYDPNLPSRPAMYYLKNKTIDVFNLNKLIRTYIQINKIPFFVAFARNRYTGTLDLTFASASTVTDVFYVVPFENSDLHYLYPSNHLRKYNIDEIPNWIAGTNAILVRKKSDNSNAEDVLTMQIPANDANTNIWNVMTRYKVDVNKNELEYVSKNTFIGDFSTNLRNEIINSKKEENPIKKFSMFLELPKTLKVDTFTVDNINNLYPYNFSFSFSGKVKNNVELLNNNVYSISLENLLNHYMMPSSENKRILNYYSPFPYTNTIKLYFQIDKDFEILTSDIEKYNTGTNFSNYTVKYSKIGNNILLVESKYEFSKFFVMASEYDKFHQFNESVKKASQARVLIKVLE